MYYNFNNIHSPDPPSIDVSLSGYTDLTMDSNTTVLAIIQCYTTISPPTSIVWKRNGLALHTNGNKYDTLQIVSDYNRSHYQNMLLVKDVLWILENVTYTCEISNSVGEVSHNITARASGNMDNVKFSCTAHVISLIFMQSNPKQL